MAEANGRSAFNPKGSVRGKPCSSTKTRKMQLHENFRCMNSQITAKTHKIKLYSYS